MSISYQVETHSCKHDPNMDVELKFQLHMLPQYARAALISPPTHSHTHTHTQKQAHTESEREREREREREGGGGGGGGGGEGGKDPVFTIIWQNKHYMMTKMRENVAVNFCEK